MSKTALITGINGMDGSHLAELLLSKGYIVCGTVRPESNLANIKHISKDLQLIDCDINSRLDVDHAIYTTCPDEIYNLSADSSSGGGWNTSISTTKTNGQSVLYILECIKGHMKDIKYFQASSSEVFKGHPNETAINEITSIPRPTSPYGISKSYSQNMVKIYRDQYDMYCCSGILFTHESERRNPKFLVRKITQNVAKISKGEIKSFTLGNLDSKRDWGSSRDFVEAMWLMLQQDKPEDFVISTGYLHAVRDICNMAFESIGITDWSQYIEIDEKYAHNKDSTLIGDNTRIGLKLGWKPKTRLEDLIKEMVTHDL